MSECLTVAATPRADFTQAPVRGLRVSRMTLVLAVALVLCPPRLAAQVTADAAPASPQRAHGKSSTAASIIGVIPGAGHIYVGETGRGLAFVGGMFGSLMLGSMLLATHCVIQAAGQEACGESALNAATIPFFGVWAWSIVDAGRAARRTNAKRGLTASLMVVPTRSSLAAGRPTGGIRLGLAFSYR